MSSDVTKQNFIELSATVVFTEKRRIKELSDSAENDTVVANGNRKTENFRLEEQRHGVVT